MDPLNSTDQPCDNPSSDPSSSSSSEFASAALPSQRLDVPEVPRSNATESDATPEPVEIKPGDADGDSNYEMERRRRDLQKVYANSFRSAIYFFITMVCTFLVLWVVGPRLVQEYYYAAELGRARAEYDNAVGQLQASPLDNVSMAYQLVAQRIRPSVVSIETIKDDNAKSIGSGVIFSEDGYIVTNAHVAKNCRRLSVELYNHRIYEGQLVGLDPTSDLAVLKINAPDLIPAEWGDSESIDVGSMVWAIGSPFRLKQTITSGVLSGKDRPGDVKHRKQSLLQTDAAVNPGNSGGPLVDIQGKVIGINLSILGERFQGISFAVPSSTAKFVYQQLVDQGNVNRGYLGVVPREVDQSIASRNQLSDLNGARLLLVHYDSPAWTAGVREDDIILQWDGKPVRDYRDLFRYAEQSPPDSSVELKYLRSGDERTTTVTMGRPPALTLSEEPSEFSRGM